MARVRDLFFETLKELGIEYIFGNPGTTELPIIDGCTAHPEVTYVPSLHEDVAVGMAMGYARASGKVGIVNLHVAPGLAHGLGNLYNAYRAGIPLVVTAGQQPVGFSVNEPILTADLAAMARPFCKWSFEVRHPDEFPVALQRAFKVAMAPPAGPVFLSLPSDVMLAETNLKAMPVTQIGRNIRGDEDELRKAAQILASAKNPMIMAGDGVGLSGAWQELTALAERLGAPVYTEALSTLANFPSEHSHYLGSCPSTPEGMRKLFAGADVAFLCGFTTQAPQAYYDGQGPVVPEGVRLVFLHENVWEIGKNQYGEAAVLGEVKTSLGALLEHLDQVGMEPADVQARNAAVLQRTGKRRADLQKQLEQSWDQTPIAPARVAAEVAAVLPENGILASEAISNTLAMVNYIPFRDPLAFWGGKGGGLGHGAPAALGLAMGAPDRPVISVIGDGTFLYYPQVLWTAVHMNLPVVYVVLNNTSYRILKQGLMGMGGPWGPPGAFPPGLDITGPDVDFTALATTFGMTGERVTNPADLRAALERGLAAGKPYLVDVVIDKSY